MLPMSSPDAAVDYLMPPRAATFLSRCHVSMLMLTLMFMRDDDAAFVDYATPVLMMPAPMMLRTLMMLLYAPFDA